MNTTQQWIHLLKCINLSQANSPLTKSGLKNLLMHKVSHHSHVCRIIKLWPYCDGLRPRPTVKRNPSTGEDRCHTEGPNPTACRTVCRSRNILERWEQIWTVLCMQCLRGAPLIIFFFSFLPYTCPCIAVPLCATACQSRPRRPGHTDRAVGDKQDGTNAGDPWNRWP